MSSDEISHLRIPPGLSNGSPTKDGWFRGEVSTGVEAYGGDWLALFVQQIVI